MFIPRLKFIAALLAVCCAAAWAGDLKPTDLRCEYRDNPLGIDAAQPRLTWKLASNTNGAKQSAYQIVVSSSEDALKDDKGDLWDSGKVESAETVLIAYAGKPLASRMRCFWKVRVWDGEGVASEWSAPAHWTMGLLKDEDWSAQWIGYDAPDDAPIEEASLEESGTLDGASWIWSGEGAGVDAPAGSAFLRKTVDVKPGLGGARIAITGDNEAQIFINGKDANGGQPPINVFNRIFTLDVKGLLKPGKNTIAIEGKNTGDTANPAGVIARLELQYKDSPPETLVSDATWKAAAKADAKDWNTAQFDDAAWGAARVVAKLGEGPWKPKPDAPLTLPPPPYLRKEFDLAKQVKRATVYASALGLYELRVNGQRIGDDQLAPGWTEYTKRVYYRTYDVTRLVHGGARNALGAILADGWYAGYAGFRLLSNLDRARNYYQGEPRLCVQLEVEYEDGHTERIVTDPSWKVAYGEIRNADILMGETRDLRRTPTGWDAPGFDDAKWAAPVASPKPAIAVQPHPGPAVKELATFTARTRKEIAPGVYIYDLGQNMVGWARIKAKGKPGQRVQVRQSEMLQDDGSLYRVALRKARAIDSYYLRGEGEETLEPAFTFHGFRYVEISGLDTPPAPEDVTGVVIGSAIEQTGKFECSEPLLNQLFHNIVWGQRGNYLEIPTDCPQRDERLGWTGDAQFFMPTSAYTADIGTFFTKWLVDLVQDSQFPDGSFADIAPNLGLGGGNVAWGDAAIICTYQMYRYYGDTRVIQQHFDHLVKGMQYLEKTSKGDMRTKLGYGDWLNLGGKAKDEVICTAYYAYLADLMAEMAELIGRVDDAKHYRDLHARVRDAFIKNFVAADGKILDSSQTGYALAFTMDLLPEDRKAGAAKYFVQEIARFDNHLATGFIGTPRLLPGLQAAGKLDVAYQLLMTKTFPSWLYQVTLGATTMWERWDGWTPEKGFQDPGMNSFNHYAFGAVGQFLYEAVGGIQPLAPGFRKVRIAPVPGSGLTHARVSYNSIRGEIVSEWRQEPNGLRFDVSIPPNVTAEVCVPTMHNGTQVSLEGGKGGKPTYAPGVAMYALESGSYRITVTK